MDFYSLTGQIAERIANAQQRGQHHYVVALDGRSGVGKSTLAKELASQFDALIVEGDDFYAGGVLLRSEPPETLAQLCIDRQALHRFLRALLSKGQAQYKPFDWQRFDGTYVSQSKILTAKPLIIVEGVYSGCAELRDLIDLSVLLVLDESERMRRLLAREGEISAWEAQWHRAEGVYFAKASARFDCVLNTQEMGGEGCILDASENPNPIAKPTD